ncbi:multidrug efflux SMR transporter [Bacillus sp. FJAT-47783]|uniref:DMT family transporter n=1 Tax=Bacillus sp. FJAT-47783 TaxID=2922712 RepID=UPI001FABC7E7|nr:multidrug efflux SMR transporter [Bacillus sp. FJAT-47783]
MNSKWILVVLSSLFEVGWVIGLKHASSGLEWTLTILAMAVSFWVIIYTSKFLTTSTVYAVFVGLGTAGTILAEIFFFGEQVNGVKLLFILLLVGGIIGLKVVTPVQEEGAN